MVASPDCADPHATDEERAPQTHTAAVVLIGNELLTGKIRDENGYFLTGFLRRRGIALEEISVVSDDDDRIGAALLRLCATHDFVFTSGGVGPTHDDRTLAAVSKAFGRPLERHAQMEAVLRAHFKEGITPAALSMADLPAGTVPCALPGWPVLRLSLEEPRPCRLYILPGVPALLRAKLERLETLEGELPQAPGWVVESVDLQIEETVLAAHLDRLVAAHPGVEIGSYPRWEPGSQGRLTAMVRVTLEAGTDRHQQVLAARDALLQAVPGARAETP